MLSAHEDKKTRLDNGAITFSVLIGLISVFPVPRPTQKGSFARLVASSNIPLR